MLRLTKGFSPPTERVCLTCARTLPITCFYENVTRPPWTSGRWHTRCKECLRSAKRRTYHDDIDRSRARGRKYAAKRYRKECAERQLERMMHPAYLAGMRKAAQDRKDVERSRREAMQRFRASVGPTSGPTWVQRKIMRDCGQALLKRLELGRTARLEEGLDTLAPPTDAHARVLHDDSLGPLAKLEALRRLNRGGAV